jgi:hypothetical protein
MRTTPLLAAVLMLGGISCAYAQEGPSEGSRGASERGSPAAQERSSGSDAGVSKRSEAGEKDPGTSVKNGDSPKGRSAEQSDQSKDRSTSGRAASETGSEKSSKSTAKSDSDDASGSKRVSREGSDTTDKSANTKETSPADKSDRSATDTSKGTTTDQSAEGKPSGAKAKHVDLTGDKRTKVQSAFRDVGSNVKHRTNVDIDIFVGRRLPRDWDFIPVPSAVIAIVPEYRGYYFAYVEDEYVIIEPDTYEVVAVLPAEGSRAGASSGRQAGSGQCSAQLSLTSKERELVIDNVKGGREADVADISVGLEVPKGVELLRFPDSVLVEAKALEGCQYFDAGDQIAIVDPDEDKIVLLIDKS